VSEEIELPGGWVNTKLENICIVIMGQSPPSTEYNENSEGLPFFQGKAEFTDLFPNVRKWCTAPTKIAEANDILLSIRAPVGPTNLAPSRCSIGRGLAAIRPECDIEVRYILYAIRTFNSFLTRLSTGTTFEAVSGDDVRAFEVPLAPLPEQRRIVSAIEQQFSRLDAGVAALRQAKEKLKRYRAAVLKAAVEGKLTETWRAEHPATEPASRLLERILAERRAKWETDLKVRGKDPAKVRYVEPAKPVVESLPELPEGWCWATVGQLLIEPPCNGNSVKGSNRPPGVAALRLSAMSESGFDYSDRRYIPISDDIAESLAIREGDYFVSRGNGSLHLVGRGTLAQTPPGRIVFPDTMIRLRFINIGLLRNFIACIWSSAFMRTQIKTKARTTAGIYKISQPDVESFILPLPPLAEQEQIVTEVEQRLSVVNQLEATVEANLKRAERLRQSILKEAFAGRLVPQDPNDEPASVLLERIRRERSGRKNGRVNQGRVVSIEAVEIDVEGMQQVELWEVLGDEKR
jgi:type I restriction enzyme S subunit